MKRRYRNPLDPEVIEDFIRHVSEMTPEDWDRELAWRPPPEVYDPWPPYENGTSPEPQSDGAAAGANSGAQTSSVSPALEDVRRVRKHWQDYLQAFAHAIG